MLYFFLLLIICICTISFIIRNKIYIKTSTMAIVMAFGILTEGVIFNFFGRSFYYGIYGKILSIIVISLWLSFVFSLFMSYFNKIFKELHFKNPINRFGIGTWVAGTSICGIIIFQQFSEWAFFTKLLLYVNIVLWIAYIGICVRGFYELRHNRLSKNVHGILLLTTVSTQSLVLFLNNVYHGFPTRVSMILLTTGLCFYFISCFFIIYRYCSPTDSRSMEENWNNTNCILHGALSITGLASIVSHAVNSQSVMIIWITAATVFCIVEFLEVYRLFKRIKCFGMKEGVLIYDVTQWSRIFTFGMFYTFTLLMDSNSLVISLIQNKIILIGIWAIFIFVIIEILLGFQFIFETYWKVPSQLQKSKETD